MMKTRNHYEVQDSEMKRIGCYVILYLVLISFVPIIYRDKMEQSNILWWFGISLGLGGGISLSTLVRKIKEIKIIRNGDYEKVKLLRVEKLEVNPSYLGSYSLLDTRYYPVFLRNNKDEIVSKYSCFIEDKMIGKKFDVVHLKKDCILLNYTSWKKM